HNERRVGVQYAQIVEEDEQRHRHCVIRNEEAEQHGAEDDIAAPKSQLCQSIGRGQRDQNLECEDCACDNDAIEEMARQRSSSKCRAKVFNSVELAWPEPDFRAQDLGWRLQRSRNHPNEWKKCKYCD